jgi:DNA replication protein
MMEKVINILKNNITIPKILITNYKDLKINELELVVLIYLLNEQNEFNPSKISEELKLTLPEVLDVIEKLNKADLISINTNKNNGVIEEKIDLSNVYKKIAFLIVNAKDQKEENTTIYDRFEEEFGRSLSSTEYEIIGAYIDDGFSDELIECALKEAVFNGACNLRYIDKILYEWRKKGIKNKEDVMKDKQNFKKNKENKKINIIDEDWLNEE